MSAVELLAPHVPPLSHPRGIWKPACTTFGVAQFRSVRSAAERGAKERFMITVNLSLFSNFKFY